ncbi:MAG TPA: BTAD domain-containing putative transcriptional regulator [Syntrophomonadaceae bacterium]|nr:BTAD domain-containing putative transcriptional regulator [Syntrophomonadaceae bacterium]
MASVPLIHAQLVPPHVKNIIRRKRLRELGLSILYHRVTTVVAPAGYGKSVWVSSLPEEPGWPPTAWLSLDRHDTEPSFLLVHLIHAIRKVLPNFGQQTLRTLNSLEDVRRDWSIAVSSLCEEIPIDSKIVLVLDDYYLIEANETICSILEHFIRWLPACAHLVLISRNSLPLNLYNEQLQGELLEIRSSELLFSIEEIWELLSFLGLELAESEVAYIHFCTEGWAAGLRLLSLLLKQSGGDINNTLVALQQKDADLYNYLSYELLGHLPQKLQDFLLDSSLLPYLETRLCEAALQYTDSDAIIKQFHAHGILSLTEGETPVWRLHHLMGEFLSQKAISLRAVDYISSIRHRAAIFLESEGDIDRALEQLAACADWPAMVSLINRHGDDYFVREGRLDALSTWLDRLPQVLLDEDYWLLYFKGMSILYIKPAEALDILSHAADIAGKKEDLKFQIRSLHSMIAIYAFANDIEKLKETSGRIKEAALVLNSAWSRGVVLMGALSQSVWQDDIKRGIQFSLLAEKIKMEPVLQFGYLSCSSIIQYRQGNLTAAREMIEKLLTEPFVQENERWTGQALVIYTMACTLSGNLKKTAETANELLRLGQKYHSHHQTGMAYRRLAHLYLAEGQLELARENLTLSREPLMRGNNIFMALVTDLDLVLLRVRAGENAWELLPEARQILDKLKTMLGGYGMDDYAQSVGGIIAMEAGQLELAREWFEELSRKCEQKGARQTLAGTQLFLARLCFLQGDNNAADKYLRKALGAAQAGKWEYFWDWHPETVYSVCWRALIKNIHPQWAVHLLLRWFPERLYKDACGLLASPDEIPRDGIISLLQNKVRDTGMPVIHLNCLGGFRVFVNGVEIPPSQWKTKKTENVFKYLVMERGSIPKEKIIREIWPEADPHLGNANLKMTLNYVRKALGLNEYVNESVVLRHGMLGLNHKIQIHTDYELFASIAQSALENTGMESPSRTEQLVYAAELYRGVFLPENFNENWTFNVRTHLHHLYLNVMLKLVESYHRQNRPVDAIQDCCRCLILEPAELDRSPAQVPEQGFSELCQAISGALFKEAGNYAEAEKQLLNAYQASKDNKDYLSMCGTAMHLADLYYRKKDYQLEEKYLTIWGETGANTGYEYSREMNYPTLVRVCARCIKKGINADYMNWLISKYFGDANAARIMKAPAQAAADPQTFVWCCFSMPQKARRIKVKLFGSFKLMVDDVEIGENEWKTRKVSGILKHILANPEKTFPREVLATLFWPESNTKAASASLRAALYELKKTLDHFGLAYENEDALITENKNGFYLCSRNPVETDADSFSKLYRQYKSQKLSTEETKELLIRMTNSYDGDFLEGDLYDEHVALLCAHFKSVFVEVSYHLARLCLGDGELEKAETLLLRHMKVDPFDEMACGMLIRLYNSTDQKNRAASLRRQFVKRFEAEMGVKPDI